jgi:hypothetical protein
MTKAFWSIPALAIYLYVITILTQYGFYSYFGIPSGYIDASITSNTTFFYTLVQGAIASVFAIKWGWLIIIPVIIFILKVFKAKHIKSAITLLVIASAYGFVGFGNLLATHQTAFLVLEPNCASVDFGQKYIIPQLSNGEAVLVPVSEDNKIDGSFLVKNAPDLNCKIKWTEIGLIKK